MIDEFKLRQDTGRAAQAQRLLDDELLSEAFGTLEKAYAEALFVTKPHEQDARERLFLAVNIVRKVKDHLKQVLGNGKVAQRELDDLENRSKLERMRRAFAA